MRFFLKHLFVTTGMHTETTSRHYNNCFKMTAFILNFSIDILQLSFTCSIFSWMHFYVFQPYNKEKSEPSRDDCIRHDLSLSTNDDLDSVLMTGQTFGLTEFPEFWIVKHSIQSALTKDMIVTYRLEYKTEQRSSCPPWWCQTDLISSDISLQLGG